MVENRVRKQNREKKRLNQNCQINPTHWSNFSKFTLGRKQLLFTVFDIPPLDVTDLHFISCYLLSLLFLWSPNILSWRSVHVVPYDFAMYAKYKYNHSVVCIMLHMSWLDLFRYVIDMIQHCVNFIRTI